MIACFIPIIAILMLNYSFDLQIEYTARFLLLYPLAIIPFSYVTSFFFSDEIIAQIVTLFMHFTAGSLYMLMIYLFQLVPLTANIGDALRYLGLLFPTFCVTNALILSQNLEVLVQTRNEALNGDYPYVNELSDDLWAWSNLKVNMAALIAHFVIGLAILATIESPVGDMCNQCKICGTGVAEGLEMELDDDVLDEELRVDAMMGPGGDSEDGDGVVNPSVEDTEAPDAETEPASDPQRASQLP